MKERKNKAEYSASDAPRTHLRESVPDGPTDGPTDGRTDGRTNPLIEMLGASKNDATIDCLGAKMVRNG